MRLTIICFITLALLTSCNDKETINSEIYIGTYRIMDQIIPYPYIIQQKKDSTYLYDNKGNTIDKITNNSIKKNKEIKFQKRHLKILNKNENEFLAFDLLDTINFRTFKNGEPSPKNGARFEEITSKNKLDLQKVKKRIINSVWKYDVVEDENNNPNNDLDIERLLYFKNDSLNIITNYYYQDLKLISEYEIKAYAIFEIDDIYFFSLQKEANNPQPIYQILEYDLNTIDLKDYSSREPKNISFYKSSMAIEDYERLVESVSFP